MKFPFYKDLAFRLFCLTRFFLAHFALISLIIEQFIFASFSSALAADLPINVDGSTNTSIDRAANNVPIVNIAAPNSGGLSHNKFTDYNVNQRGLILNNATGGKNGFTQSQIGGLIQDNANLKNSGSARIILNEVTSNNISRINGYTEIAGGKADLIIANPNGISMAGAGFINASKLTAIVGSPNQLNPHPNNLTFSLSGNAYELTNGFLPQLTISGAGLDLESVSSTDLVANLMNIVSPIYGGSNDVNLRAGDQNFDYLTKAVSSDNSSIEAVPNSVAIDASALGKIQAGRIFIIATKEGFGVKYSGDLLASRSGITIDSQGNIAYNNIAAEVGDIDVKSHKGSIEQAGISQTKSTTSDITLNALGDITNLGQFLSARNINLGTKASFSNQGSNLNLSDNDFIIEAVELNNLGKISAKNNLTITATSKLTNSKELVAGNILTITAPQIINEDSIYSNHQINITATDFLTNNKEIISLGDGLSNLDDGIYITAKSINNNKEISSKNNITINSNSLNNNLANSTILALKDINLNLRTLDNSSAKIQSGRKLTIKSNKSSSTPSSSFFASSSSSEDDEDSSSLSIFNSLGSLYGASSIDLDFGDIDDYTITGTIETSGSIEISAKNIINQGNVSATDFIKLTASNNFTNGFLNSDESFEDNANVKLAAGTYLEIVAANEVNNYATLSATTNLTITATNNNINNSGEYAKIIGGSGTATLNANNGSINNSILYQDAINQNYSFITSSNSLIANATSSNAKINAIASFFDDEGNLKDGYETLLSSSSTIKNFIKVLVDGEYKYTQISKSDAALTTKLNQLYRIDNSEGGAIVANNDLILNAVNLNNYNRIDVANNFTINASNNLNNFASAMIYSGNEMKLNVVNSLNNYSDASLYSENNLTIQKHDESSSSYDSANNKINQLNNISANIISYGGNVNIEAESFVNERDDFYTQAVRRWRDDYCGCEWEDHYDLHEEAKYYGVVGKESYVYAGVDIDLKIGTLTNDSSSILAQRSILGSVDIFKNNSRSYKSYTKFKNYWWRGQGEWNSVVDKLPYTNLKQENLTSIFKAGVDVKPLISSDISNENVIEGLPVDSALQENPDFINSIDVGELTQNGIIETNLSNYLSGPKNQGLFTKNQNPNAPLFETRSDFIDQSKFFGSDYFYTRIGLNLTDVQTEFEQQNKRLVGDQFFQTKIIEEQLRTISKNSLLLSSNEINVNNEIKSLLDNAADEYSRLGLAANNALTQTQINSLEKDIIWFETKTIDGSTYIVPTIYLSQTTRDNLKNGNLASKSTIFAKENVELTSSSGSIINGGSIVGNNVTLKANSNILNSNFSDITASNNLSLISDSGSIINKSDLSAKNDLSLTTLNGDIYNIATIKTNAKNLLDGDYSSDSSAYIRNNSGITNSGEINSTLVESANIKAGSVIINSSKNFTNLASNISTTKNTITNTSDGSTSTTDGNISITAGDNINIATLEERNRTIKVWGSKKKGGMTITDTTTNVGSNINSEGSISISADRSGSTSTDKSANVNIIGSSITASENINITATDDVNITSAQDTSYKETKTWKKGSFGSSKSSSRKKTAVSQISSELTTTGDGDITIKAGDTSVDSDVKIIGSKLSASEDINLEASGNVIIANAVNSELVESSLSKKGSTKKSESIAIDYVETAQESEVKGENINITSSNNVLVQGSELVSNNNTNISSDNIVIQNAELKETHFSQTKRGYHGIAKVGANITSTALGLVGAVTHLIGNVLKPIDDGVSREAVDNLVFDNSLYNIKQKEASDNQKTKIHAANIEAGNNINLASNQDTIIQASNLKAGTADKTADQSDSSIEGRITIDAQNLSILAGQDFALNTYTKDTDRTLQFNNWSSGSASTKVVNSELTAKNEGFMMNVANKITASYDQNRFNEISATLSGDSGETSGLKYLTYLKNNKDNVFYNPVTEVQKDWGDATRGLTDAGTAVVVVGAVVATIVTAGAAGFAVAGTTAAASATATTVGVTTIGVAVAGSAASTAAVTATNVSMNVDGDIFKQAKGISKETAKATTSKESLENMAIAGATAAITFGLTQGVDALANSGNAVNTTNAANGANTTLTLSQEFTKALQNSAIQSISSSVAQSTIKGDSLSESLQNSIQNIVINAVGELAANEIGNLAHPTDQFGNPLTPKISTAQQLTLHAGLGCGMAAAGGNNCASGAVAGVIGESFAEYLGKNTTLTNQQIIESSKLAGALTAAMVAGSDDGDSVFAGSQIARNAAENNYILGKVINQKAEEKLDKILTDIKGKSLDQVADQYVASKDPLEKAALFTILSAGYVSLPASTTELELMMATAGLSRAFAPQIGAALNRVDDGASGFIGKLFNKTDNASSDYPYVTLAEKDGRLIPANASLTREDARLWYNQQLNKIDTSLPATKENAMLLHNQRNDLKIETRNMMMDRNASLSLDQKKPIMSFEYYENKYLNQGYSGEQLWQRIISSSSKPNPVVNSKFNIQNK